MPTRRPRLREFVRFERRLRVADGAGNFEGRWDSENPVFEDMAEFNPINGREEVLAQKLTGVQPYEIVIRVCDASSRITTDCRAVWVSTGWTFDITAIQNADERRKYFSILAKKGVADG